MSILLDSGNTENKPRLCATDGHNNLQINQTVIGFLSEFVSVGLHRVPYPGTGESENKVTSAHDEALKTVGYGRLEKPCTVYYNNPFDPRLTFDGLGHLLTATDTVTGSLSKEQLAQNVFLALENSDVVMDDLFSQNRNLYQALCSSTDLGLSVDPNRYKLFPEIDGNVSDDGSEDCKRMFEKICSHPIKDLWTHTQEGTERVTCDTDRKPDSPDQTAKKTHTANEHCQCEAEKNSPKTHNLPEKNPPKNKIRYSFKRLEGKKKSSVEPDQNALYDLIERDIEQVLSEESDEEDRGRISDSKVTPIHLMTGDTMTGARLTADPKCPREVTQTGEEATKTEPTLSGTRNAQHKEPHFTTAELKHGVRQVPLDPCQNDPVQTTTTNETGSAYKEAKIQEFKEEMEKITSRKDVPKTLVVTGDPHITTQNNAPSHMEYSEFSLDSIVAKSVLRPSVPSFYPGFNKGGTAAIENEHMFVRKTQTTAHNRGTRPPPGIGQQNTYGDQNGAHNAQGPPNWANTSAAPQTQNTGHVATGNFQNHNTAAMRDVTQKIDFRSTLINPRPCHQPANVNKLQLQPTHAATAALLMANCIQQSSGKDAVCNQPQQPLQNKPHNEFLPPIRLQQYQQQCGHLGMQNPYPGHTARNPPPGFNDTTYAPMRNRDHLKAPYRSEPGHPKHHLPLQQHLAFRFSAEQSFQHQQQQQTIGGRFPQPAVQNVHQHHLVQQQLQQQQQQQHHNHQQQQQQQQHQQQQQNPLQLQQQQQQQQQHHQHPHHPHPPLHPLQPQQHFLNPEVPPFQYFNKMPQQTNVNMRANLHLNIQAENTNRNNANVDRYEENAIPLISFNSSRLTEDPTVKDTPAEDPGMKTDTPSNDSVRIKRMSVSAECIPSLVNGDCNRESSKDKHRVSKFRSRRSNLVRIYPS